MTISTPDSTPDVVVPTPTTTTEKMGDSPTTPSTEGDSATTNTTTTPAPAAAAAADTSIPSLPPASPEKEWPDAFYCHETHVLLTDPVVGPDGNSYERSKVIENEEPEKASTTNPEEYYANRALQVIIEESLAFKGDSFRASLRYMQQSVSNGLSHLLPERTVAQEPLFRPLNDAYYCPITFNLMHEPVIDPEGNTFERVAVENWIRVNQHSPITRTELRIDQLYPNRAIQSLMQAMKEADQETMHPAIQKWKEEPIPQATDLEWGGGLEPANQDAAGAGMSVTVLVPNYPLTPSQWTEREHARRQNMIQVFGFFFGAVCLMGFVLYGEIFFLLLFVATLLFLSSKRQRHIQHAHHTHHGMGHWNPHS